MGSGCGWYPPFMRKELMVGVVESAHHLASNTLANMAAIHTSRDSIFSFYIYTYEIVTCFDLLMRNFGINQKHKQQDVYKQTTVIGYFISWSTIARYI